ncbi:MAG: dienelactone hydrolase family protein [Pseudomonadales bacterium]|nr:dienelactone hydrolase family protein [Pseudomonadales bacterium]
MQIKSYRFSEAGDFDSEYGLFVPTTYQEPVPAPLLVALHGHGSGAMYMMEYNNLVELAENYGFIVATPVGFSGRGWFGSRPPDGFQPSAKDRDLSPAEVSRLSELDVMNVVAEVRRDFAVNNQRIYLIGQSMGGSGTWYLASQYPDLWAAIAPLSPVTGEEPEILTKFRETPVLLIAGDRDIEVEIEITRRWVDKMAELNMDYEYLEIPGGTHSASGRENLHKVFEFLNSRTR